MGILDQYHRGFKEYRLHTENNNNCEKDRKEFIKSNEKLDSFVVKKYVVDIDEAWIIEIEKTMEYIEKAVAEERQFITSEGEIVPIEKAKKVSRESVAHLAKHSNMITHKSEDSSIELVPDSIYMVEKQSDFAVYENRFLYLLLCYLRDFVDLRIKKIEELRMTYICDFSIQKSFEGKLRNHYLELKFHQEKFDNPYPISDPKSEALLERIKNIAEVVYSLLNTNLMMEVSKAPMVRPPIVKTNVLKMNNNFKNALALYNYIVEYSGDGYTKNEVIKEFMPFSDLMADELMEVATLTKFLTYKFGNDITGVLEIEYKAEEERRRKEEIIKLEEQIKKLRKKVLESGISMEEYIFAVEKKNKMLEEDSKNLTIARNEILNLNKKIEELYAEIKQLNFKIEELNLEIEKLNKEIAYLNQKYIDDMNALKKAHAQEILELNHKHDEEIEELNEAHEQEIEELNEAHEEELDNQAAEYEARIEEINELHTSEIEDLNNEHASELESLRNEYEDNISNLQNEIEDKACEYNEMVEHYEGRVKALLDEANASKIERKELIDNYEKKLNDALESYNVEIQNRDQEATKNREAHELTLAELRGLRAKNGLIEPSEDMTDKERFEELENEFEAFNKFFKSQWKMTKKSIRKELIWTKEEKKKPKA